MSKTNPTIQFLIVLIAVLGLLFFIHVALLRSSGFPPYGNMLVWSYLVNGLLAAAIFILLYVFRKKLKNSIGFLFMAGSFLKFIVFFIVFYPSYKIDGDMNKLEFAAFFVPYAICLILETVFTAKMLQKMS
ncbi:DUF6168 family protein [Ulvibacterium marinum]|uniref:Uncharacterized protein n=1 Tax=Ulvibacterium marinum TaxID=2419782 RepID=A0A3B0CDS0_9FLAO|nr:DUF6168 family protein [Ulvibacterium marinum]RKN82734.1 hypothetical protein D7Z94_02525 [Ulvibacterium marinum]